MTTYNYDCVAEREIVGPIIEGVYKVVSTWCVFVSWLQEHSIFSHLVTQQYNATTRQVALFLCQRCRSDSAALRKVAPSLAWLKVGLPAR